MFYKENNVFEEALERVRMLYDTHDDIIVSMSGGKDSTVLFHLALIVAKEKNRLPVKVFWLDQEAEWQHTVDYMDYIMHLPEVEPYWFQIPFDFTNSLSAQYNFLRVWDENEKDKWIHEKSDISIKENPTDKNRFHLLMEELPKWISKSDNCAVLSGLRMIESQRRRLTISFGNERFNGITWAQKKKGNCQVFWPIHDFDNNDVWVAIGKNHWKYNEIYDLQYRWGIPQGQMRVSALIHETSWHAIELLQEFEPKTYNRFCARVHGVNAFSHSFDYGDIIPKKLPFAFKDWKEYRDYLLVHITKAEYWDLFRNRWKGQDGELWYKTHVREVITNDIDGTINANAKTRMDKDQKVKNGYYFKRDLQKFNDYMKEKEQT